jgi:hypothetical protein
MMPALSKQLRQMLEDDWQEVVDLLNHNEQQVEKL